MVSAVYEMLLTKQNLLDYVNSAPVMKVDPYSANRLRCPGTLERTRL